MVIKKQTNKTSNKADSDIEVCPTCGSEFDAASWRASKRCPECETPHSILSPAKRGK